MRLKKNKSNKLNSLGAKVGLLISLILLVVLGGKSAFDIFKQRGFQANQPLCGGRAEPDFCARGKLLSDQKGAESEFSESIKGITWKF